jgi:hypothetical protein
MKPMPANPTIIIAHVEGSGTGVNKKSTPKPGNEKLEPTVTSLMVSAGSGKIGVRPQFYSPDVRTGHTGSFSPLTIFTALY